MKTKKRKNEKKEGKKRHPKKWIHHWGKSSTIFAHFYQQRCRKKMKVKKNFEKKNIKQKKEKPCNPKKQKRNVFLDQIWLTYEKHSDPKLIISFGKVALSKH